MTFPHQLGTLISWDTWQIWIPQFCLNSKGPHFPAWNEAVAVIPSPVKNSVEKDSLEVDFVPKRCCPTDKTYWWWFLTAVCQPQCSQWTSQNGLLLLIICKFLQILNSSSVSPVPNGLLPNSARWDQLWWAPTSLFHSADPKPMDIHGGFSQISVSFGSSFDKNQRPSSTNLGISIIQKVFSAEFIKSEKQKMPSIFWLTL